MVKCPQCKCPHTQALFTLIGKKWTLFIMHSVQEGATTFTEIKRDIGDVNTKILADRLAALVECGILYKNESGKYFLTAKGGELTTQVIAMANWWAEIESNENPEYTNV